MTILHRVRSRATRLVVWEEVILNKKHNHSINQKKNEKCICEEEHSFKKCSYIVKFNRKRRWKKNKNIKNEMRDQIKKRLMIHRVIKHIIDTNILNELDNSYKKKKMRTSFRRQLSWKRAQVFASIIWSRRVIWMKFTSYTRMLFTTLSAVVLLRMIEIAL